MEQFLDFLNYSFPVYGRDYTFGQMILVPIVALFGVFLVKRMGKLLQRKLVDLEFDQDLILLSQRLYFIAAYFGLFLLILSLLQIPLTAFAFFSGAVAIGVGFGAQNIINNFISGWILMWERPIRIGDFLELGEVKGTVETINTRSTRIRRVDGVHLLVPNSQLLENTVVNWTLIDKLARAQVRVGVAYGSPVRKVEQLILKSAMEHPDIIHDPEPVVFFEDFGDSALIFDLFFWINAFGEKDLRRIKSDIRFRIDELFNEAGIVIAFPQQDVHLDGRLELVRKPKSR
jgi:small-conductance mechanosensitive channel